MVLYTVFSIKFTEILWNSLNNFLIDNLQHGFGFGFSCQEKRKRVIN